MRLSLAQINQLGRAEFAGTVGPVFEHSPWIAELAWLKRPFATVEELHRVLCKTVHEASPERQLALIRAHPDLAGRAAPAGPLTRESANEQAGAGLNELSSGEIAVFQRRNAEYLEKFGFPFVICARLNKKEAMLAGFQMRLKNPREGEMQIALEEIFKIAEYRLRDLISVEAMTAQLSTHVLDTAHGCPAAGMKIELWSLNGGKRALVMTSQTNADGRTDAPLLSADEMKAGSYEIIFFVGDYFAAKSTPLPKVRFFDRVPVRFSIADAGAGYHVPLLCSPWAYSTYRGS